MDLNVQHIRNAVQELGITDSCVCIHSSFRSFGPVAGGPGTIIDGLLAEGNTVMAPTFSNSFRVPPPHANQPLQNGMLYSQIQEMDHDRIYHPELNTIDSDTMGAVPAAILQYPGRIRGNHPFHSFTAIGPMAEKLISGQSPVNVYAPLKELATQNGYVVFMGVGLDRLTLLHLAENMAGRRLFIRWAKDGGKQVMNCRVGGCSLGFNQFESVLAPYMNRLNVGQSRWIMLRAKQVLEAAIAAIKADPGITHCEDSACMRCNDAVLGGPIHQ